MRRTKKWWSSLSQGERIELVALEHAANKSGRSSYIPDDCLECEYCSTPSLGSGLCPRCENCLSSLITKADQAANMEEKDES